ncbi:DUF2306 domain-containing protein [Sphingomonas fennica]|uniref:DUF2306 domain-containing protein n=1 Tax=Edaphosphingomonas fennica TaxID=114404 RepID=A0A2T4I0W9_9SPHN|nr:DUF2306 domain-containing protein [Sphingomonas fennica]PTD22518.1 hypothetical protein CV103_09290 [Sphingomonas fennica]
MPRAGLSRSGWAGFAIAGLLALGVSAYAARYPIVGPPAFAAGLRDSFLRHPWAIYVHAGFGAVALGVGFIQLNPAIRSASYGLHRWLGRAYATAAILGGAAGLYLAPYADTGPIAATGFGLLAVLTMLTTAAGWIAIRSRRVAAHRRWMIRSYALIFAAVTLRIELPLLIMAFGDFVPAYRIVAWLCWVPNLLAAEWWLRRAGARMPPELGGAAA